jgi:hypothetical protein
MFVNNHKAFMFDIYSFCGDIGAAFSSSPREGMKRAAMFAVICACWEHPVAGNGTRGQEVKGRSRHDG